MSIMKDLSLYEKLLNTIGYPEYLSNTIKDNKKSKTKRKKTNSSDNIIIVKEKTDDDSKKTYVRTAEHNNPDNSEILLQDIQNIKLDLIKEIYEIMGDDYNENDAKVEYRNYLIDKVIDITQE